MNVVKEYFKNPKIKKSDLCEIENQSDIIYPNYNDKVELQNKPKDRFLFYFY